MQSYSVNGTSAKRKEFDDYMESNFPPAIMASSNVDWVLYYFPNGTLAIPRIFNSTTRVITTAVSDVPPFLRYLSANHPLRVNMNYSTTRNGGYYQYGSDFLVMSSAPLTISDYTAGSDTSGFLVFARTMRSKYINDLAVSAQLCVSIHLLTNTNDVVVKSYTSTVASTNGTYVVQTTPDWENIGTFATQVMENDGSLTGRQCWKTDGSVLTTPRFASFALLNDINGNKLMIVRTDIARDVYYLGIQSLLIAIGLLLVVCIFASVVVIIFVEKRVLSRILSLTTKIQFITASHDSKQRITVKDAHGTDELGSVAKNINYMLDQLDSMVEQQRQEQELLKKLLERISAAEGRTSSIMNSIKDIVLTVSAEGIISHANTAFYERIGYATVDIEGGNMPLDKVFPQLKEGTKNGDSLGQVISSYDDGMAHPFTGVTRKKKSVDFDAYVTKTKIGDEEQHMFVFVARISSQMLGTNTSNKSAILDVDGSDFDKMMLNPDERELFKEFCRQERSEENILFLEAVLDYKSIKQTHERMIKQETIIQTFLLEEKSPFPINVSGTTVKKELAVIQKGVGQLDLFDNLFTSVKNFTSKDTYSRFKISLQ